MMTGRIRDVLAGKTIGSGPVPAGLARGRWQPRPEREGETSFVMSFEGNGLLHGALWVNSPLVLARYGLAIGGRAPLRGVMGGVGSTLGCG